MNSSRFSQKQRCDASSKIWRSASGILADVRHVGRPGLVVLPAQDEGRRLDLAEPPGDVPILEGAGHRELAGPFIVV
jgi:hypothetical protein